MLKKSFLALAVCATGWVHAQEAPIRIGVIGPFTGQSSSDMGESIRGGARVFADEVNRLGGVLGRKVELVEKDDQAKPDIGTQLARDLIEKDKVVATVGFANIGVANKAVPLFQQARVPLLVSAAAGGEVTKQANLAPGAPNYIFRVAGRDMLQTKAMFKDLVDRRKITEIAILHDETPYGTSGKANALIEMEGRKLKPVATASFKIGDQDMTAQLTKAKAAGAKAIALYGLAAEDAMVARSLAKMGWKVPLVGTWTMSQRSFMELAGPAGDGARTAVTFIEDEWRGVRLDFGSAYRKLNKVEVIPSGVAAAQTYDALRLLYLAIYQANSTDGDRIRSALESLQYAVRSTVVTRYDQPFTVADHEAISANMVVMGEIRNGRLAYAYKEDENSSLIMRGKE
ncbi:MAG: ABC transporter substrate-binding protein [Uliginosibacterium sp.]|jgi:branched-chain amino acid transport system substrate-binding protein|nr:ABC transporter substrate-binding protein [Uliginosibacterium sp.]MBK9616119.1 ABC transporter substrate-binding protein [Uliginosibacterium sp.]